MISINRNALATGRAPFPKQTLETMRQHTMTPEQTFGGIGSLKEKLGKFENMKLFLFYIKTYFSSGDFAETEIFEI